MSQKMKISTKKKKTHNLRILLGFVSDQAAPELRCGLFYWVLSHFGNHRKMIILI